jgi:2-keto-4-pentenoate hydratase/2-oxohepta-3-ene-1,7-dioic acid hydratase in catechol pathway
MLYVRYTNAGAVGWAVEDDGTHYDLSAHHAGEPTPERLANERYRDTVRQAVAREALPTVDESDVEPLAPIDPPGQLICVGLNYHDHAEEQDEEVPEKPLLFGKSPRSVANPGEPIVHPEAIDQVDYEVELAIVIGRTARNVSADEAAEYVAGYTICNDVSGRDAQFEDGQFFRGKSFESFAPLGPALVTGEDFDPNAAAVSCTVNGETKQDSNTNEFIFDVGDVVEYISGITRLEPGDVISTGTPGGVGIFRDPPELLESGDSVTVAIDGIGELTNPVVEE